MPQLLDIHRSGSQIRQVDFAVCIRSVGTRNQIGTSTIGVNAKFPARQVFSIFGCLGQIKGCCQIRCSHIEICRNRVIAGLCRCCKHDLITAIVPHKINVIVCICHFLCRCYQGILNLRRCSNGQPVSVFCKLQIASVGKAEIGENPVGIGDGCRVLTCSIRCQFNGRRSGRTTGCKTQNRFVVGCHICGDFVIAVNDGLQPSSNGNIAGGCFRAYSVAVLESTDKSIICLCIGRVTISPANGNLPNDDLGCDHIG